MARYGGAGRGSSVGPTYSRSDALGRYVTATDALSTQRAYGPAVSESDVSDSHDDADDADDDPPFDVVQAVLDFVAEVIEEVDAGRPDGDPPGAPDD